MIKEVLERVGLTDGEIRVFEALLELGASATGKIIKKSGVSGSKVYEILERLKTKGLVTSITKNKVLFFETANPERLLTYIDEKKIALEEEKREIQKIIPELILKKYNKPIMEAKIFTGWEGIKSANEDIFSTLQKGEEWLSMGLSQQPESWEIHFNHRQEFRAKKGIILKHLLNEKYKTLYEKRKHLPHTNFRFLPREWEMPSSTEIYKNKVMIIILNPNSPMAIVIENEDISNSFKTYFNILWKQAKH